LKKYILTFLILLACSSNELVSDPYAEIVRSDLVFENVSTIKGEYVELEKLTSEIGIIDRHSFDGYSYKLNPPDIFNDIQNTNLIVESSSEDDSIDKKISLWKEIAGNKPSDLFMDCEDILNEFIENEGLVYKQDGEVWTSYGDPWIKLSDDELALVDPKNKDSYDICNDWLGFFESNALDFTYSGPVSLTFGLNEDEFKRLGSSCYETIHSDLETNVKESINWYYVSAGKDSEGNDKGPFIPFEYLLREVAEPGGYGTWSEVAYMLTPFSIQDNFISLGRYFAQGSQLQANLFVSKEGINYNLETCQKYTYEDILYDFTFPIKDNVPFKPDSILMNKYGIYFMDSWKNAPSYYSAWSWITKYINFLDNKSLFVNFAIDY
tara:strand:+ start:638 stop:1777 length:1140 start_codon:yes stop_codon:yes gene_type:complete